MIFIFSESGLFYTEYTFNQIPPTRFFFSTTPAPSPNSIALHGFWIYLIPFSFFLHFFLPSFLFFLRQGYCVYVTLWNLLELQTKLVLNSWDLPISASPVRKLKVCTTTVQFIIYLFIFDYRSLHLGDILSFRRPSEAVLLCMYGCFASLYVCILHACLMPVEVRRDNQILRTGVTYRWMLSSHECWE